MSEKRKPMLSILLKKQGKKTTKIEIFDASLWGFWFKYRVRVNNKWFNKKASYNKSEFKKLFWNALSKEF